MREITSKMYFKLYDVIHHKIEICTHKNVEEHGSKYVHMINTIRQLRTLVTF